MVSTEKKDYRIAVGLDGSDSSWSAFAEAIQQAKCKQAILHIVSIQESIDASYSATEVLSAEQTARSVLEHIQIKAKMQAENEGLTITSAIVTGHSAQALNAYVKDNSIDLLIIGDTGHSSIWGALLGTTADKIMRSARCSVLIVRVQPR